MSASTRTPAQAAGAGAAATRAPAKPRRRALPKCTAHSKQTGQPCRLAAGYGTDHVGVGNCRFHGGNSPNGRKAGRRKKAEATLAALAIPADGDPLEVLQASVEAAHGVLLAARELVKADASDVTLKIYLDGIERAARVAKAAAEAVNLDELVRIREREADLLEQALVRTLSRFGIAERRQPGFLEMLRQELREVVPAAEALS